MIAGIVLALATYGQACVGVPKDDLAELQAKGYEPTLLLGDVFNNGHVLLVKPDGSWIEYVMLASGQGCIWALGQHMGILEKGNGKGA
ncbi:MAG: hypothetical protein C5B59_17230 [Bacteroidetes bacterium]|nr:MAG: hypothetical protein C5B59_17230 [Bacteroidota bacterium]